MPLVQDPSPNLLTLHCGVAMSLLQNSKIMKLKNYFKSPEKNVINQSKFTIHLVSMTTEIPQCLAMLCAGSYRGDVDIGSDYRLPQTGIKGLTSGGHVCFCRQRNAALRTL